MEMRVKQHNLKWWIDHGLKCPDCDNQKNNESTISSITILSQNRGEIYRINSRMVDEKFTAEFYCPCGCTFEAEIIVKDAYPKKNLWEKRNILC